RRSSRQGFSAASASPACASASRCSAASSKSRAGAASARASASSSTPGSPPTASRRMKDMGSRAFVATTFLFAALWIAAPSAFAAKSTKQAVVALPAAGELVVPNVVARSAPSPTASHVKVLTQFRPDYRQQEVLAVGAKIGTDGQLWYRLSLPMRPN